MNDNQFNQLVNALHELLEGIERVEKILSEPKKVEYEEVSDCEAKESRVSISNSTL